MARNDENLFSWGFFKSCFYSREREFSYKEGAFMTPNKPCKMKSDHKVKFDVILTSYEFVNMDSATLMSVNWSVLVIDEAHRLKNNQSLVRIVSLFFPAMIIGYIFILRSGALPLKRWMFCLKPWKPKGFFQFEISINVLVSSFRFICIPML